MHLLSRTNAGLDMSDALWILICSDVIKALGCCHVMLGRADYGSWPSAEQVGLATPSRMLPPVS